MFVVYLFWPSRRNRERLKCRVSVRAVFLQLICVISAFLTGLALLIALGVNWLTYGYRWERTDAISDAVPEISGFPFGPADYWSKMSTATILLVLAAVLLGLLFAARFWVERAAAGAPRRLNPELRTANVIRLWLGGFLCAGATLLLPVAIGSAIVFYFLLDLLRWDHIPTTWDLFLSYPFLPAGLLATAGAVVSLGDVTSQDAPSPDDPPDDEPGDKVPNTAKVHMGAHAGVAFAAFAVGIAALLYPLHLVIVVTTAPIPAVAAARDSGEALARWADARHAAGQSDAEIVAALNASGHWSPDTPADGLARLLPALVADPDDGIGRWPCTVTVTAGPLDAAERKTAPWLEEWDRWTRVTHDATRRHDEEMTSAKADSDIPDDDEERDPKPVPAVRFCLKVACPSPVAWDAPDVPAYYSSHPTGSPDWVFDVYADLLLEGRPATPGGYCTTDGELADVYQG